jgi:hypothetical protein
MIDHLTEDLHDFLDSTNRVVGNCVEGPAVSGQANAKSKFLDKLMIRSSPHANRVK